MLSFALSSFHLRLGGLFRPANFGHARGIASFFQTELDIARVVHWSLS